MKNDFILAINTLNKKNLSLVITKNNKILYQSNEHGIKGILKFIKENKTNLKEAALADKILGQALAWLILYSKIKYVYAKVISKHAQNILNSKCYLIFEKKVSHILNKEKKDLCPFEKISKGFKTPEEAYQGFYKLI